MFRAIVLECGRSTGSGQTEHRRFRPAFDEHLLWTDRSALLSPIDEAARRLQPGAFLRLS